MASKTNVKNQISQAHALLINETKTDWIFFLKPTVYKASQAYHIVQSTKYNRLNGKFHGIVNLLKQFDKKAIINMTFRLRSTYPTIGVKFKIKLKMKHVQ